MNTQDILHLGFGLGMCQETSVHEYFQISAQNPEFMSNGQRLKDD